MKKHIIITVKKALPLLALLLLSMGALRAQCPPVSTFPWSENFNTTTGTACNQPGNMPACWLSYCNGQNAAYYPHVVNTGYDWYSPDNSNSLYISVGSSAGENAYVALPEFAHATHYLTLTFWYRSNTSTGFNLVVGYFTDASNLATSFVPVQTYTGYSSSDGCYCNVSFANVPANAQRIGFRHFNTFASSSCCIDNVQVTSSAPVQYTIATSAVPTEGGTVTGGGTFNAGATTALFAIPNSGYQFSMWSDGSSQNPRSITVTADASYTAYFTSGGGNPSNYTITTLANPANGGTVTGGGTYPSGSTATLTATANSGYQFTSWHDGSTQNPRPVTVTADATYIANFTAGSNPPPPQDNCDPIATLPWTEDFNTTQAAPNDQPGILPDCWHRYSDGSNYAYAPKVVANDGADCSNAIQLIIGGTPGHADNQYVALPRFSAPLNTLQMTFWYAAESHLDLILGYFTSTDLANSFIPLKTYPTYERGLYTRISLEDVPATAQYIGFRIVSRNFGGTWKCLLDDITVEAIPAECPPTALPYFEDFNTTPAVATGTTPNPTIGTLPDCWLMASDGNNMAYYPKVVNSGYGYYSPDDSPALFMANGGAHEAGSNKYVALPKFQGSVSDLTLSFWNRHERGTIFVGYYTSNDLEHSFVQVATIDGSRRYDTISFAAAPANAQRIGIRFNGDQISIDNITVTSSATPPPPTTADITTTCVPANGGTVTGAGTYPLGSTAVLTAVPASGYQFTTWHDGVTQNPRTVTVTADAAFTAIFTASGSQSIAQTDGSPIRLYPNPAHNQLTIEGYEGDVFIVDLMGRVVKTQLITHHSPLITLEALPQGTYFVKLGDAVRKLIVQ